MSKNNRQRRRDKRLRRARAAARSQGQPRRRPEHAADDRLYADDIKELIVAATAALRKPGRADFDALVGALADVPPDSGGTSRVDRELDGLLGGAAGLAWRRGWQPGDLARLTSRQLGPAHTAVVVDAIALDRHTYAGAAVDARWQEQLDELGADAWWSSQRPHLEQWQQRQNLTRVAALQLVLEALSLLWTLPTLPRLGPLPGDAPAAGTPTRAHRAVDSRMLARVRALLAKAESTTFPEEAEALSTKAQELMARHMIDRVMLDQAEGAPVDEPRGVRISVDDPYASPKSQLLSGVAGANRCRAIYSPDLGFSTVFGHEIDLETVELLYSSLLVQATSAMVAAGRHVDHAGRSRTRSFRHSFLLAYAARISARLREANRAMVAEADEGANLLPVLASRERAVEDAVAGAFPHLSRHRVTASNEAGWNAGTVAANLASLSTTRAQVRTPP